MPNATSYSRTDPNASGYGYVNASIDALLLENGDNLLLQNGDNLLLGDSEISSTNYSKTDPNATNYAN